MFKPRDITDKEIKIIVMTGDQHYFFSKFKKPFLDKSCPTKPINYKIISMLIKYP